MKIVVLCCIAALYHVTCENFPKWNARLPVQDINIQLPFTHCGLLLRLGHAAEAPVSPVPL